MPPEIRIVIYIGFIISLFFLEDPAVYFLFLVAISVLLIKIPFRTLKKGWVPIGIFLVFTFLGNVLFRHGKILFSAGPLVLTDEGFAIASLRTARAFFMIAGAKILTSTTKIESLIDASGKLLRPLEGLGFPGKEFLSTMRLTMKSLPGLKAQIVGTYRDKIQNGEIKGFRNRAGAISLFLVPLFVKSMQSPEKFFEEEEGNETREFQPPSNPGNRRR